MNTDGNKLEGKIVYDKRNKDVYFLVLSVTRIAMIVTKNERSKPYATIRGCHNDGKILNTNHKLEDLIEYQSQS